MINDEIAELREQVSKLREDRAAHAEKLNAVATRIDSVSNDVKTILGYMERTKGSWKTLVILGGVITGVVEAVHQLAGIFHK